MCRGWHRFAACTFPSTCGRHSSGESKQGPADSGNSRKSKNIDICRCVDRELGPECIQYGSLDLLRVSLAALAVMSLAALAVMKSRHMQGKDLRKERRPHVR